MRQYLKNYLTWGEDWIKPFESSYSVFRNLAKINGFRPIPGTLNMLLETRKTDYSDFYCTVPYKGYGVTKALLKFNQLAGTDRKMCIPQKADKSAEDTLIAHKLRGCPECLKYGYNGKYITSFDTIRYILDTFAPEKTEYNERSLSIAGIEMLIVSTTLICELLVRYKNQIDCYDYPYLYMSEDVQNDNICSFSNILWNYLRAVKGSLDDTDILDLDMFLKGYSFSLSDHVKTFAAIPYCSLPFFGLQKNKIFIDCAEDQFWYQWEQYQKIFKNTKIKSTQYAWTKLDPVSYIILQRQDDSFDGYRIIDRKHITKR